MAAFGETDKGLVTAIRLLILFGSKSLNAIIDLDHEYLIVINSDQILIEVLLIIIHQQSRSAVFR